MGGPHGPKKLGVRRVGARRGGGAKGGGPKGVGPTQKKWGPEGWGPEGWGHEGVGARNFALFFPLPPHNSFFSSVSGGLLVEFWWCLKRRGAQMCTFGVLWLSCEAPPKRVHFRVPSFKNTTKIPREDPQRGKKRTNFAAGEGKKKERNFGGPGEGRSWEGRSREGRSREGRSWEGWFSRRTVLGRAVPGGGPGGTEHDQTKTLKPTPTPHSTHTHTNTHTHKHTTHTQHHKSKSVWPKSVWPKSVWPKSVWPKSVWPKSVLAKVGFGQSRPYHRNTNAGQSRFGQTWSAKRAGQTRLAKVGLAKVGHDHTAGPSSSTLRFQKHSTPSSSHHGAGPATRNSDSANKSNNTRTRSGWHTMYTSSRNAQICSSGRMASATSSNAPWIPIEKNTGIWGSPCSPSSAWVKTRLRPSSSNHE